MNKTYVLLYPMLYKLSYLNLQFNYIPVFHRYKVINLRVKRADMERFYITAKVSPIERWDVILMKGIIALLTVTTVI